MLNSDGGQLAIPKSGEGEPISSDLQISTCNILVDGKPCTYTYGSIRARQRHCKLKHNMGRVFKNKNELKKNKKVYKYKCIGF